MSPYPILHLQLVFEFPRNITKATSISQQLQAGVCSQTVRFHHACQFWKYTAGSILLSLISHSKLLPLLYFVLMAYTAPLSTYFRDNRCAKSFWHMFSLYTSLKLSLCWTEHQKQSIAWNTLEVMVACFLQSSIHLHADGCLRQPIFFLLLLQEEVLACFNCRTLCVWACACMHVHA